MAKEITAKKITYLLGAGASANTIPVVKNMHQRINEVYSLINNNLHTLKMTVEFNNKLNSPATGYNQLIKEIAAQLKWLIDEAGDYYTIDTLAKKYYLTGDSNYEKLKSCLILYFVLEQYLFLPSDPVIGYSFPIFNRELDNKLFDCMDNLEKVYIQDSNPEIIKSTMVNAFKVLQLKKTIDKIKSVSSSDMSVETITVTEKEVVPQVTISTVAYTDQFVIPYELTNK